MTTKNTQLSASSTDTSHSEIHTAQSLSPMRPSSKRTLLADPEHFKDLESIRLYYKNALRPLTEMVADWPPMLPDEKPPDWKDVVPHFDWEDEDSREAARRVRDAEFPFVIRNVPSVVAASKKYDDKYLASNFRMGQVEESASHSFMYWTGRKRDLHNNAAPPTQKSTWSWDKFVKVAKKLDDTDGSPNNPHYYWHVSGSKEKWITEDLELFRKDNSFFIVDPEEFTVPIACRVGSKGLCNEMHYDGHRTFATQLVGSKRWIWMPPSECSKLYLYPEKHISSRHSPVDINSGYINGTAFPLALGAMAIETVIYAGEVGYLPSNWFHHIISLEFNMQCVARSGHSLEGDDYIEQCGFKGGRRSMKSSGRKAADIPPKAK